MRAISTRRLAQPTWPNEWRPLHHAASKARLGATPSPHNALHAAGTPAAPACARSRVRVPAHRVPLEHLLTRPGRAHLMLLGTVPATGDTEAYRQQGVARQRLPGAGRGWRGCGLGEPSQRCGRKALIATPAGTALPDSGARGEKQESEQWQPNQSHSERQYRSAKRAKRAKPTPFQESSSFHGSARRKNR